MPYRSFVYSVDDSIATIRLNRPDTLNSLTFEVYEELERAFTDLQHESAVRAVVLTGEGRGFCSPSTPRERWGFSIPRRTARANTAFSALPVRWHSKWCDIT